MRTFARIRNSCALWQGLEYCGGNIIFFVGIWQMRHMFFSSGEEVSHLIETHNDHFKLELCILTRIEKWNAASIVIYYVDIIMTYMLLFSYHSLEILIAMLLYVWNNWTQNLKFYNNGNLLCVEWFNGKELYNFFLLLICNTSTVGI